MRKKVYKYVDCPNCDEKARIVTYRLNVRMDNGFIIESNDSKVLECKKCKYQDIMNKDEVKDYIDNKYKEIMTIVDKEFGGVENMYKTESDDENKPQGEAQPLR